MPIDIRNGQLCCCSTCVQPILNTLSQSQRQRHYMVGVSGPAVMAFKSIHPWVLHLYAIMPLYGINHYITHCTDFTGIYGMSIKPLIN